MKGTSIFSKLTKGKKLLFIAPALALVLAGGIVTATVLTSGKEENMGNVDTDVIAPTDDNAGTADDTIKIDNVDDESGDTDAGADVSADAVVFADPVKEMNVLHTFGFYYNSTLGTYYEHEGIDLSADEGAEVYATTDGTVTAVYTGDVLTGGQIVLEGAGGIVTTYSFVDPIEGLIAGTNVSKGDLIATVSAATGGEYKDGAHVHIEVSLNGETVDPENYLTTTEK